MLENLGVKIFLSVSVKIDFLIVGENFGLKFVLV